MKQEIKEFKEKKNEIRGWKEENKKSKEELKDLKEKNFEEIYVRNIWIKNYYSFIYSKLLQSIIL
jgi:hypothetical protein